ncbi:MAG TPA: DUF397 domain-containing protein [Streptosporangiaceae bacterium]|nr:DUF397 domain-containing protein [Streptosporangiaceae bacterium]
MHAALMGRTGSVWSSLISNPAGWLDTLREPAAAGAGGSPATWREGGPVADFEEPGIAWRKSLASDSGGCVEVAAASGSVLVRDSANRDGAVLRFPPVAWSAFLQSALSTNPAPGQA